MEEPALEDCNTTELLDILRRPAYGYRLRRDVSKERLIDLIRNYETPKEEEFSGTVNSRTKLEAMLLANWSYLNSQLPCKGENRGRCTIYPCSEGRHLDCYIAAEHLLR